MKRFNLTAADVSEIAMVVVFLGGLAVFIVGECLRVV